MLTYSQVKIEDCPSSPPVSCHAHIGSSSSEAAVDSPSSEAAVGSSSSEAAVGSSSSEAAVDSLSPEAAAGSSSSNGAVGSSSSEATIGSPLYSRDLSTHASLQLSSRPIIPATYTTPLKKGNPYPPTATSLRAAGFIHPSWPEARSRAPYVLPRGWYRASDGNGNTYFYNGLGVATWLRPTEIPGLAHVTQAMVDRYNNPRAWAEPPLHSTEPTDTPSTPAIAQGLMDRHNTRAGTEGAGRLPLTPKQADVPTDQPNPKKLPRAQQLTPAGFRGSVPHNASSALWAPRCPSSLRYQASTRSPATETRHAPPQLRRSRSSRSPSPATRGPRSVERSRKKVRFALDEDITTTTTTIAAETKPKFYSKEPFSHQKGKEHIQTCYFWNHRTIPRCTNGDRCRFMHECSRCHSTAHGRAHCDSDLGKGYRRGPRREGNAYSRR